MLVFNGETQKGNNNAGLNNAGTQPTFALQSFKVMKALLSLASIPVLLLTADILQPPPPSQAVNRYTNKKRQQSILPEGVRWVSPSFPQIGSILTGFVRSKKANGSHSFSLKNEWRPRFWRLLRKAPRAAARVCGVHCTRSTKELRTLVSWHYVQKAH